MEPRLMEVRLHATRLDNGKICLRVFERDGDDTWEEVKNLGEFTEFHFKVVVMREYDKYYDSKCKVELCGPYYDDDNHRHYLLANEKPIQRYRY